MLLFIIVLYYIIQHNIIYSNIIVCCVEVPLVLTPKPEKAQILFAKRSVVTTTIHLDLDIRHSC